MANIPSSGNPRDEIRTQLAPGTTDAVLERIIRNSGGIYKLTAAQYNAITNKNPDHIYIVDGVLQVNQGPQPLSISGVPDSVVKGQAYTFTPTVSGGSGTKRYSLRGSLPQGMTFDTSTGIGGTPTSGASTRDVYLTVTDDTGSTTLGPLFFGPSTTQAVGPNTLRIVGAGGEGAVASLAGAAFESRFPFVVAAECSEISFTFDNKTVSGNGEVPGTNSIILDKVAMERTDIVTSVPLTFSGARNRTLSTTDYMVKSDTITAASLGLITIPKGFSGFIRTAGRASIDGTTSGNFPGSAISTVANSRCHILTAADSSTVDATGALAARGTLQVYSITYTAVIGRPVDNSVGAVMFYGDSLAYGAGDTTGPQAGDKHPYGNGPGPRACWDANIGGIFPFVKFARTGGFDFIGINSLGSNPMIEAYASMCKVVYHMPATNDLNANHNPTTVFNTSISAFNKFRSLGVQKIIRPSLFPRITGTVLLADGSDQTIGGTDAPDWNPGGNRETLEALYQGAVGTSVDYYIDVATPVAMAGTNRGKWAADGTNAGRYSADKTHPTAVPGWRVVGTTIRPSILAALAA